MLCCAALQATEDEILHDLLLGVGLAAGSCGDTRVVKKSLLRAYKTYLGGIDPDWDGEDGEGRGGNDLGQEEGQAGARRGAANGRRGTEPSCPPARGCFMVFSYRDNSCARDTVLMVLAAAELNGGGPFGGVSGGIIRTLAEGLRTVRAESGG